MVNKANEAAMASSTDSVDSLMSTCPLNDELIVIHPMRYSVKQRESYITLDSKPSDDLPVLKEHSYIMRPVIEAYVYLFNEKDDYVLMSEFNSSGEAIKTECILGEVPSDIQSHFPVISQKKKDKFSIMLSHVKVDEAFIEGIFEDKEIRKTYLQYINVSKARKGKEAHCKMVEDLPKVSPDFSAESFNFDWSLWSTLDLSPTPLMSQYKPVAPESHIAVAIIDSVGISIDLCTLFNVQYDAGFTHIAETQYPYTIARATKMLIDREAQKGFRKKVNKRVSVTHEPKDYIRGLPTHYNRTENEIKQIREDRRDKIIKDYHDVIHNDAMSKFQKERDEFAVALSKDLEQLAKDWVAWLESDYTDFALALYSPFENEQIQQKEIAVANMLGNIQATEVGKKLQDEWVQDFVQHVKYKNNPTSKGMGGQIWTALGLAHTVYQEVSKGLKLVYDAGSINWNEVVSSQQQLISDGLHAASEATDSIQYAVGEKIAQFVVDPELEPVWHLYYQKMAERYGYQYGVMNTSLNDVLDDIEDFNAVQFEASAEHILVAKTTRTKGGKVKGKNRKGKGGVKRKAKYFDPKVKIKIYQLDAVIKPGVKPSLLEGYAYWVVKNVDRSNINNPNSKLGKWSQQLSGLVEKHSGRFNGLLLIAQVANLFAVSNKLLNSKEIDSKLVFDASNALVGTIQSTLAFIQSVKFSGSEQAMKIAAKTSINSIGLKSTKTVLELGGSTSAGVIARYSTEVSSRLTSVARFGYKALPVVGNLLGAITSWYTVSEDFEQGDNVGAKVVAVSSFIVNSAAFALAVAALIPGVNAVVGFIALVLALVGVALDFIHSWIEDSRLETFLKSSLWGMGSNYKYYDELPAPTSERVEFFKDVTNKKVQEAQTKELVAFTDELFRPTFSHSAYDESGWFYKYESFTLQIYFPGYLSGTSQVSLKVLGVIDDKTELLFGKKLNEDGSVKESSNKINLTPVTSEGSGYVLEATFNEKAWKKDYDSYKFDISYINPNAFRATLRYSVDLDDDAALFWQDDVDADFELQK